MRVVLLTLLVLLVIRDKLAALVLVNNPTAHTVMNKAQGCTGQDVAGGGGTVWGLGGSNVAIHELGLRIIGISVGSVTINN